LLLLHRLLKLPRQNAFDGDRCNLFSNAFVVQKAVES